MVKQVHVVVCELSPDSDSYGGFEWRLDLADALKEFRSFRGPARSVYVFEAVDVPQEFQDDPTGITDWVDSVHWGSADRSDLVTGFGKSPICEYHRD